ncbi:hypothetical protein [Nocardioides sambongensis]|uniref:hypothetical protein n=1 Tax=Nocardioides sambongensis TaxID=2589074 RepID=UPI0015E84E02|nr:hypothetical protein [Nocardioides sambongensis]
MTVTRWISALFAIGSLLFVVGSVPAYLDAVGPRAVAATYAVGSIWFTAAAFVQLVQAQDPRLTQVSAATQHDRLGVPQWRWGWHDPAWSAAASQFPGTLLFNVSTFAALIGDLTEQQQDRIVWRPDLYGSVLFLVASTFGLLAVGRLLSLRPRSWAWWAAWLNMAGSVAFMASALGAYVLPSGSLTDAVVANGGTLVGALCFFAGAMLLLPAWRQDLLPARPEQPPSEESTVSRHQAFGEGAP